MFLDVRQFNELWPVINGYVKEYFADKYGQEVIENISQDLKYLLKEGYLEEIQFIYYDETEKKETQVFSIKIEYQSKDEIRARETNNMTVNRLGTNKEKILLVKLTTAFKKAERKNEIFEETLVNHWEYTNYEGCVVTSHKDVFAIKNAINVKVGEKIIE